MNDERKNGDANDATSVRLSPTARRIVSIGAALRSVGDGLGHLGRNFDTYSEADLERVVRELRAELGELGDTCHVVRQLL